jgi:hypothetical protein
VSNFDQFPQDKMWTLRLDRAHVLAVPLKPQGKMLLCIDDDEDALDCEKAFLESLAFQRLTRSDFVRRLLTQIRRKKQ